MWMREHTHTNTPACLYWTHSQSHYVYFSSIASISLYQLEYMPFSTIGLSSHWGQESYIHLILEDLHKTLNRGGASKCSQIGQMSELYYFFFVLQDKWVNFKHIRLNNFSHMKVCILCSFHVKLSHSLSTFHFRNLHAILNTILSVYNCLSHTFL